MNVQQRILNQRIDNYSLSFISRNDLDHGKLISANYQHDDRLMVSNGNQYLPAKELIVIPIQQLPEAEQFFSSAVDLVAIWLNSCWVINPLDHLRASLSDYVERYLTNEAFGFEEWFKSCIKAIDEMQLSLNNALHDPNLVNKLGQYKITNCRKIDNYTVAVEFHHRSLNTDDLFE